MLGEIDNNEKLIRFAKSLEKCSIQAVEDGFMTKDLAILAKKPTFLDTCQMIEKISEYIARDFANNLTK